MWIYRVDRPQKSKGTSARQARQRHVDIDFSPDYKMHVTHIQRLATEFRVPLFEGFTMPSSNACAETAALYNRTLLMPLAVLCGGDPEDISASQAKAGATVFSRNLLVFSAEQENHALLARQRFLDRYEYPPLGNRTSAARVT